MKRILLGAAGAAGLLFGVPACAQTYQDSGGTYVRGVVPIQPGVGPLFTTSNPGKISGSFSALRLAAFSRRPAYSQLSVGAASARVALPSGSVVIVYNTGSNSAFVTLGNSSVTATTAQRRHPRRRLDGIHRRPEHISCRDRDSGNDVAEHIRRHRLADWRGRRWRRRRRRRFKRFGRIDRVARARLGDVQRHARRRRQHGRRVRLGLGLGADRSQRASASTPTFSHPLCPRAPPRPPIRK